MDIVFVTCLGTHFRSMQPMMEWANKSGFGVVVHIARQYPEAAQNAELCKVMGYRCSVAASRKTSIWNRLVVRDFAGVPTKWFTRSLTHLIRAYFFYRSLFRQLKGDLLVIPEENIGYLGPVMVKAAHSRGMKCLVVPFTIDNPQEAAEAYYQNPQYHVRPYGDKDTRRHRKAFAGWFPQWCRTHKGVQLLRFPYRVAMAFEALKFAPPDPWQNTCSFSDALVVESASIGKLHACSGVSESKIHVVGSVVLDDMAEKISLSSALREELLKELGLDPDKPVFLAALPPDQFNTQRTESEFSDHESVVSCWLENLAATGWNVVVNLHPHLKPERINFGRWSNVKYCPRAVADVIPLCDVYVACISATIRWAIAAGKPVVNHDLYRYNYDDYRSVPGVVHVETKSEFAGTLKRIVDDAAYLALLRRQQEEAAPAWGILDGKCGERLSALLQALTSSQRCE